MRVIVKARDLDHAIGLLREGAGVWSGDVMFVEVDPVCRFNGGEGECGQAIASAVLLLGENESDLRVVAPIVVCSYHAVVMAAALDRWRSMQ